MIYEYIVNNIPDLDVITNNIKNSSMQNKEIVYMTWEEKTNILKLMFNNELTISDKNILVGLIN